MSMPGKALIVVGGFLVFTGLLVEYGHRLPFRLGRLPGDIAVRGKYGVFYFPLATCLLLSVVLSLIMWLLRKR